MAVFTIKAPDGRTIQIKANDQATALRGAREWAAANPVQAQNGATATPPAGLQPGTREYANWAGEQARAGNKLPQVSNPNPEQPWDAPGSLVPIQFQQGTGNARLAMPSLITDAISAAQAPGKALQGGYDELAVDPETGSVDPFDPRMMDDTTNLASMVSPISPASRLGAPVAAAATRRVAKVPTPEIDDLYAAKDAAYQFVDKLGASYSPEAVDSLSTEMIKRAAADNISPTRHPKAYSMLVDLQDNPQSMSLTQLDQLRQVVRRDLVGADAAESHFGKMFIDTIDDFIEKANPKDISGVTGQTANHAILTARKMNSTLRKSETLQDAIEAARLRVASTGSGGNIDNALRQELVKIIRSPKKSAGFGPTEIAAMEKIVRGGGKAQDVLRLIGKLSPSGNGLMAALGLGATMTNPAMVAGPAAGLIAKTLSDRATKKGVEDLTNLVRTGGAAPLPPIPRRPGSSLTPKASTTLLEQNFGPKLGNLQAGKSLIRLGA